jgi:hypothetical protein
MKDSVMGHDQGSGDTSEFDWVNAWAAQCKPDAVSHVQPVAAMAALPNADEVIAATAAIAPVRFVVPSWPDDQLMRDIAEIERVRDRLAAIPVAVQMRRTQALTLVPSRTTDSVPVMIGGVLALVMLAVFGAAAAMSKLSR